MDQSKKVEIALTILGWSTSKYDLSRKNNTFKNDLITEISEKMITVSTGEGNPILRNEQWAYGVLLSSL